MSHDPQAREIRSLLQSVESDTARTSSNSGQIRRSVLAAFDESIVASAEPEADIIPFVSLGDEAEVLPLISPEDEPDVMTLVSLVSLEDQLSRFRRSPRLIGWMAAAAVVLVVGLWISSGGGTPFETIEPAAPPPSSLGSELPGNAEGSRLSVDGPELPALLLPGRQTTASIAGGLSFDVPEGLIVIAEDDHQLVLAVADEAWRNTGQLIIMETDLSDWEAEIEELAEVGEVSIKEIGVMVDGRATNRLDVTITNQAIAARSCTIGEPCLRLDGWPSTGPAALWAGADNRIIEIGRTEESVVLAIEASQRFTGPLSILAAQVVSTASLSLE